MPGWRAFEVEDVAAESLGVTKKKVETEQQVHQSGYVRGVKCTEYTQLVSLSKHEPLRKMSFLSLSLFAPNSSFSFKILFSLSQSFDS